LELTRGAICVDVLGSPVGLLSGLVDIEYILSTVYVFDCVYSLLSDVYGVDGESLYLTGAVVVAGHCLVNLHGDSQVVTTDALDVLCLHVVVVAFSQGNPSRLLGGIVKVASVVIVLHSGNDIGHSRGIFVCLAQGQNTLVIT
jgi:hypothetical protein